MTMNKAIITIAAMMMTTTAYSAEMDQVLFSDASDPMNIAPLEHKTTNASGYVEGAFGYGKAVDYDINGTTWALRGTVNSQANRTINVQVDGGYERTEVEGVSVDNLTGAFHVYYRQPDVYAAGAFVQGSRISSNILGLLASLDVDSYATDVIAGGEAAIYTKNFSYYGQIGFGQAAYSGSRADHLLTRGGVRIYANDNLRFDAEGALNRLSVAGAAANVYTISGTGHYRLADYPITTSLGYRYNYGEAKVGGETLGTAGSHSILAGLRFHFGSSSLKDEERTGPAWTTSELKL